MIRSGARVVLKDLARRPDLNGTHGTAVSRRKGDRWAVQLSAVPHVVSVPSRNLALAAAQGTSAHCMVIDPLPFSAPDEQVRAAIRPFSQPGLPLATEAAEVAALRVFGQFAPVARQGAQPQGPLSQQRVQAFEREHHCSVTYLGGYDMPGF